MTPRHWVSLMPIEIVPRKHAIIIAIERYLTGLPNVSFAEADARGFSESLQGLGFEEADIQLLVNEGATKSLIDSKLRRVTDRLGRDDTLFFYYAGHGFADAGHNYITCYDSDRTDLSRTSLSMKLVFEFLAKANSSRVACFVDACHSGIRPTLPDSSRGLLYDISTDELLTFFAHSEFCVCFSSCKEGQESYPSTTLGHGVWTHCLLDALEGRAPRAIARDGLVTAQSLQAHLAEQVPAVIRAAFTDLRTQTPMMYGEMSAGDFLVADVGPILERRKQQKLAAASAAPIQIQRAILSSEDVSGVKRLSGFRSTHKVPKEVAGYANDFIQKIGAEDLEERLDALVARIRSSFGFKRAEISTTISGGVASVMTPKFNASVSLAQDRDDAGQVVWRLEVGGVAQLSTIQLGAFDEVFSEFEEMDLQFSGAIDVAQLIDLIEDQESADVSVEYPPAANECTILIRPTELRIRVAAGRVTIRPVAPMSARLLVASAQSGVAALEAAHIPLLSSY